MAKERNPSSILMVSHDITEVAYMADRIIVLGANPGIVRTVIATILPRPRDYRSPELLSLVDRIHETITGSELPDVAPTRGEAPPIEPLPEATPSEIVGLLEYLDGRGGRQDVFRIASDVQREFGTILAVVRAAEMLDFVDTPKRMVVLEAAGKRFVETRPEERKVMCRDALLRLGLFRTIHEMLHREPDHAVHRDVVLTIILQMPQENYTKAFRTLVVWARFGDLFGYDETTELLSLQ